jgi:hypothetical protein
MFVDHDLVMPKEAAAAAEAPDDATCWLCRRTSAEINSTLSGETEDEAKITKEMATIKEARDNLATNSARWTGEVPDSFKEFDLAFVLQNADQFKSMRFLNDLITEARNTVRDLDEVSFAVRKGTPIKIGGTPIDESQRESIALKLNDFEKKTGRKLKREQDLHDVEYQRLGYIARLSGLHLLDGIDYLSKAGTLYYELQLEARERAMVAASKRKPMWQLRSVRFRDFPKEVWVCTVCERLLRDLRPAEAPQPARPALKA